MNEVRVKVAIPYGKTGFGVTRMHYSTFEAELLGPVAFEPSMVRVRTTSGKVRRVFKEWVTYL